MQRVLAVLALGVALLAVVNFFTFMAECSRLGGDAMNGSVECGQYFVAEHGHRTEVSREDWIRNLWHGRSLVITHPLGMLALGYLLFKYQFPRLLSNKKREDLDTEIDAITRSGQQSLAFRCGGRIGKLNMTQPLMAIALYPGGIVMKPLFMAGVGIPSHKIEQIARRKRFLTRSIEIHHRSDSVTTPVCLYCGNPDDVFEKLRKWREGA